MAWLILGIIVWGVLMFLVSPLLKNASTLQGNDSEVSAYKSEIMRITESLKTTPDAELESRKLDLQRQLLTLTKTQNATEAKPFMIINALFAFFIFGAIGLYTLLGAPDLINSNRLQTVQAPLDTRSPQSENLPDLLAQLKQKLETTQKSDAKGWMLYARTLMNVGDFPEAFKAYEEVLALTGNNSEVAAEYARARRFAANPQSGPKGPTAEQVAAAQSMSQEDRSAMIENMVSGLAARLRDNPDNPEGWIRLLTARRVLGQTSAAKDDMAIIEKTYAAQPETIKLIQTKSGWATPP